MSFVYNEDESTLVPPFPTTNPWYADHVTDDGHTCGNNIMELTSNTYPGAISLVQRPVIPLSFDVVYTSSQATEAMVLLHTVQYTVRNE